MKQAGTPFEFGSLEVRLRPTVGCPDPEKLALLERVARSVFDETARVSWKHGDYVVRCGDGTTFIPGVFVERLGEPGLRKILTETEARWRREEEAASKVREATTGPVRRYHYDMVGADLAGEMRHPETVIRELAPGARRLQPESIADCWLFVSRKIDQLPSFVRELPICSKRVDCGGTCVLDAGHDGGCECIGDDVGEPGSCPA